MNTLIFILLAMVFGSLICLAIMAIGATEKITIRVFWITLILAIIVGIYCDTRNIHYTEYELTATEHIIALNDSNLIKGRHYMRAGFINQDLYYQYMVKLSDNHLKYNKVSAKNATIIITTNEDECRVEWYERHKGYFLSYYEEKIQKIYIPENAIDTNFYIDFQ